MNRRKATQIVRGQAAVDGAGVHLRRVLGLKTTKDFDPFLMLDGFDSLNPEDYIQGFPWHPHRGIETITYLIKGNIEHCDSLGNSGTIHDLECQWMTAGSGIIHQEMPQASPRMLGLQLWLNLPAKDKMTAPSYGDIKQEQVTVIQEDNASVRIISGSYRGREGAFTGKYVKVRYLDIELSANSNWSYSEAANDETLFIYLLEGTVAVDESLADFENKGCAVLFTSTNSQSSTNDSVTIRSGSQGARFVLAVAKPLKESIAWGGPIVMNTREELNQAFAEIDNGTFIKKKV